MSLQVLARALAFALAMAPLAATAHGGDAKEVVPILDMPRSAALQQMRIEVHKTLGYQLLLENRSSQLLEVLGRDGRPFLRIGPGGVEANLHAADWYQSYAVPAVPVPAAVRHGSALPDRWQRVSASPSWGWFDPRVQPEKVQVPHRVEKAGRAASVGRWQVPVRLAGAREMLSGHFRFEPPASGYFAARLADDNPLAAGVSLQLIPGPVSGFLIHNDSAEAITLMDAAGQPFLRVGPQGVEANVHSIAWQHSGQAEVSFTPPPDSAGAAPQWQLRSSTPRFSWVEPRTAFRGRPAPGTQSQRHDVLRWQIAYLHGNASGHIRGMTEWIPLR